jgi:hypothetical protein
MAVPGLNPPLRRPAPTAATLLFERLSPRIFAPLASRNRDRYWALLCVLHARKFGPDAPLPPSTGFSMREIIQDIEELMQDQDVWEAEEGCAPESPLNVLSNQVFHVLLEAGWLKLEKFGVEKRVTMRPAVNQFLNSLVAFAETGPVFLSGKIRSIDLNIQQVVQGKADADTLSETAEQARHLLEHVRNTGTNVRDLMQALSKEDTTAGYVRKFFDDFIERVFIGDYRELRFKEHPLSKKQAIIRAVEEISMSDDLREKMLAWFMAKRCPGDRSKAEMMFEKCLSRLLDLNRIDEYLDRLDDEVRRANKRALAYLDYRLRSLQPVDHLVRRAIDALLVGGADQLGDPFAPGEMMGAGKLAVPRQIIERAAPAALRTERPSIEKIAKSNIMLRARESRIMNEPKLAKFVLSQLNTKPVMKSGDLKLAGVSDIRAYQHLAQIGLLMSAPGSRLRSKGQAMAMGFKVQLTDDEDHHGNLIEGKAFTIERRRKVPTEKTS